MPRPTESPLPVSIVHTTLDCGLEIKILPKRGFAEKFAIFTTRYGSNDNRFIHPDSGETVSVPDGIAHFLEHKMFEKENGLVFDQYSELGTYVNAYTNAVSTAYLFSSTFNFQPSLDLLLSFVQEPYFSDATVEKEKGIIEQEIRMYDDNPHWKVYFNLLGGMYKNHPVRVNVAGTVESVRQISKEMLYTCYETFYHPGNMALFVVGDVDPQATIEQIKHNVESRNYRSRPPIQRIFPPEPVGVEQVETVATAPVPRPIFFLGFKEAVPDLDPAIQINRELSTRILLEVAFGKGSDLFNRLYRDGLLDDELYLDYESHANYGYTLIGGESGHPEAVREQVLQELQRMKTKGIPPEAFSIAKRKLLGGILKTYDSVEKLITEMVRNYHKGINYPDLLQAMEAIEPEAVEARLHEHLGEANMAISMVRPAAE